MDHTTFKEPPELEDWLTHMGIDTRNWGKGTAKTVAELFGEVRTHAHAREQTISSISRPYHARQHMRQGQLRQRGTLIVRRPPHMPVPAHACGRCRSARR